MSFSRRLISATAYTGSGRVLSARCLSLTPSRLNTSNEADPIKPIYTPLAKPAAVDGVVLSQTNRAEKTFGRFWKTVSVKETADGLQILLDSRPLRTPGGKHLTIPKSRRPTAFLIANEWENQDKVLKNHALPMTSLASRAIDALTTTPTATSSLSSTAASDSSPIALSKATKTKSEVVEALLKYFDTDTICFHEDKPRGLVKLQTERWDPLLDWAREKFGVEVNVFHSVLISRQPKETISALRDHISQYSGWKLAAFERAVYTTKSFLIALALVEGRITVEQASLASQVEVDSQIDIWGEVEDTHDVDYQDVRRQLGSVRCLLIGEE